MLIVVVENPSKSLIYPQNKVVKIVFVSSVIEVQLLSDLDEEGLIIEEVVQRVCNLLNVQVNIALKILIANWMKDIVSP